MMLADLELKVIAMPSGAVSWVLWSRIVLYVGVVQPLWFVPSPSGCPSQCIKLLSLRASFVTN
jgi:hypothetical protein